MHDASSRFDPARPDGQNATLTLAISAHGRPEIGETYDIPARCGRAVLLEAGETLSIVNPGGSQVCDFWAFRADDMREFLSMEHLRTALGRTIPRAGDVLVSNRRAPLLRLEADSSPGVHDTIIAACDAERYRQLGAEGYHDNCTDNLRMALMAIGREAPEIPSPFNIWMNVPVLSDGSFAWSAPVSAPGDVIELRALARCVAVMSACPQDMTAVNGAAPPGPLAFTVTATGGAAT